MIQLRLIELVIFYLATVRTTTFHGTRLYLALYGIMKYFYMLCIDILDWLKLVKQNSFLVRNLSRIEEAKVIFF